MDSLKESINHNFTGFFCGHFSITKSCDINSLMEKACWTREVIDDDFKEKEREYFYEQFFDFCFHNDYQKGCVTWEKTIGKDYIYHDDKRNKDCSFHVNKLQMYYMPMNMVLYSIEVSMENIASLDDVWAVTYPLRELKLYRYDGVSENSKKDDVNVPKEFVDEVLKQVLNLRNQLSKKEGKKIYQILENGGKFRLFQRIHSKGVLDKEKQLSEICLLGTFGFSKYYSEEYLTNLLDNNRVTLFGNWDALALHDSFTVRYYNAVVSETYFSDCIDEYFRMIFIYSLFQKYYLFNLNYVFREARANHGSIIKLIDDFEDFEKNYNFHKISYGFIPMTIEKAISKGLELKEEMKQIEEILKSEKEHHNEADERLMNWALFWLAIFTSSSAIFDICSLVEKLRFKDTEISYHYKTVSVILLFSVALILLFTYRRKIVNICRRQKFKILSFLNFRRQ